MVEDDPAVQRALKRLFVAEGFAVETQSDGEGALNSFHAAVPSAIILDLNLPKISGRDLCRQIKAEAPSVPVIVVSGASNISDKVLVLESGADDYVTKPFSPRELVARVNAILRRTRITPPPAESNTFKHGELAVDTDSRTASFADKPVALTALEFSILRTLLARPGFVFTRELILDAAYAGNIHVADRTIDSHVRNIRAKMASAGCESVIETVHGVGFKLGRCGASH